MIIKLFINYYLLLKFNNSLMMKRVYFLTYIKIAMFDNEQKIIRRLESSEN